MRSVFESVFEIRGMMDKEKIRQDQLIGNSSKLHIGSQSADIGMHCFGSRAGNRSACLV